MAEAKSTTWRQRHQTKQQQNMKPSIQNRNLEDVIVTATPDLLCFELVIFRKYSTLSFSHCQSWSLLCSSSSYRNCEDAIFCKVDGL